MHQMQSYHPSRVGIYKNSEWERRKDLIVKLYTEDKLPVSDLVAALAKTGFRVNKRMIMTRIMQWGIGRKNKHQEMCAAIQLLADYDIGRLPGDLGFIIRDKPVSLEQIRSYFRRKDIRDPAVYVRDLPEVPVHAEVRLQHEEVNLDACRTSTISKKSPDSIFPENLHESPSDNSRMSLVPSSRSRSSSINMQMPTMFREFDRLLWSTEMYMDEYSHSIIQHSHREPQIHSLTVHGRFGAHMQEGISLMIRGKPQAAFHSFNNGFDLISPLLDDVHPMSLALILTVLAELLRHRNLFPVISQLLSYIVDFLGVKSRANHPISHVFRALNKLGSLSHWEILKILSKADADLRRVSGALDWRALYIRERLCDALYYASESNERHNMRCKLLQDQIQRYGPNARNVLWTQALVADDLVQMNRFDEAENVFNEVLERAELLEGFGKAKTRFVALEGLGDLELKRAGGSVPCVQMVKTAVKYFELAETEARAWFENSTRRLERVRARKEAAVLLMSSHMPTGPEG